MLNSKIAWQVLIQKAPAGQWLSLDQVYDIVEAAVELDDADRAGVSAKSVSPRWKRTVRNLLQRKKTLGEVEWDGAGRFRFKGA